MCFCDRCGKLSGIRIDSSGQNTFDFYIMTCVLSIGVRRSKLGVGRHTGAYGRVTDAYECIWMPTDAYVMNTTSPPKVHNRQHVTYYTQSSIYHCTYRCIKQHIYIYIYVYTFIWTAMDYRMTSMDYRSSEVVTICSELGDMIMSKVIVRHVHKWLMLLRSRTKLPYQGSVSETLESACAHVCIMQPPALLTIIEPKYPLTYQPTSPASIVPTCIDCVGAFHNELIMWSFFETSKGLLHEQLETGVLS